MVTLQYNHRLCEVAPINGVVALHDYVAADAGTVTCIITGEQPVRIVDAMPNQLMVCTIQSQQVAPVQYDWVPGDDQIMAKTSREIIIDSRFPGSSVLVQCLSQTVENQRISLRTVQKHTASHTSSEVKIHGVSDHSSRMDVQSLIHISKNIVGIQAHQVHRHLLLNSGARATSEPMLEVLSDDVKCSHGAAISHLNAQQLFYLQSRGYSDVEARETLVKAFLTA